MREWSRPSLPRLIFPGATTASLRWTKPKSSTFGRVRNGVAILLVIAFAPFCANAQPTSGTRNTPADTTLIAVPLSELNEDAAIKQVTERKLDIRTGLLVTAGIRQDSTLSALNACRAGMADRIAIGENEHEQRVACEDNYRAQSKRMTVKNTLLVVLPPIAFVLGLLVSK